MENGGVFFQENSSMKQQIMNITKDIIPDGNFKMSGNSIHVKTLDLGKPFEQIAAQLNEIIYSYFGVFHS